MCIRAIWSSLLENYDELDDLPVIGWIAIPKIDLSLAILKGLTNQNLLVGAGTMKPEQVMGEGNYALAGHNERVGKLLFSPLHQAKKEMLIFITDTHYIYAYEVTDIKMVDPERIGVIEDTDDSSITLVTCNVDGTIRLIVQGRYVKSERVDGKTYDKLALFDLQRP